MVADRMLAERLGLKVTKCESFAHYPAFFVILFKLLGAEPTEPLTIPDIGTKITKAQPTLG
jgi:hypothetical protein